MQPARTLAEKILDAHVVPDIGDGPGRTDPAAGTVRARCDEVAVDDRSFVAASAGLASLHDGRAVIVARSRCRPDGSGARDGGTLRALRERARALGIRALVGPGNGGFLFAEAPDRGILRPGIVVATSEPLAAAWGILGAFPVRCDGDELREALEGGTVAVRTPATFAVTIDGQPGRFVAGRDVGLFAVRELGRARIDGAAIELDGSTVRELDVVERLAAAAALAEAGAAVVFGPQDEKLLAWLRARGRYDLSPLRADRDAHRADAAALDGGAAEPAVARWTSSDGAPSIHALGDLPEMPVDRVRIGGRIGGRIEDLRLVAKLLREHPIHPDVECVVVPATQRALLHAHEEGLAGALVRSGAVVVHPSERWEAPEGPEHGGGGTGGAGAARWLATSAAPDRPAHAVETWLCGPAVAAASAVFGRIAHPDELLRRQRESL